TPGSLSAPPATIMSPSILVRPRTGSVRVRARKYTLRSDRRSRWFRRLQGGPLRSQSDGGTGACGCWRMFVDEGGRGDGGGYAIHRSLDRTGPPTVGT